MNLISRLKAYAGWQGLYGYRRDELSSPHVTEGITVAIPSWNGAHLLESCLARIEAQTLPPDRIMVIDNASTDETADVVRKHPDIEHIVLPENRGYAGASQHALELTKTTLLTVLNNDAEPHERWLEVLSDYLHSKPDVAVSFPLSLDPRGRIDSAGDIPTRAGFFYKRGYGHTYGGLESEVNITEVMLASGVAGMYRVAALRDIGGWDRGLHSYLEDVDLSLRLWLKGWEIAFIPGVVVIHEQGTTGDRLRAMRAFLASRNEGIVVLKNYQSSALVAMIPSMTAYFILSLCSRLIAGGMLPFVAGKCAFLLSLPNVWRMRNTVYRKRKLTYGLLQGNWLRTWLSLSVIGGRKAPNAS